MAYNALVGNRDDHPRNHGLLHDGTGWRLSKAFDITPLPTFTGLLAMNVSADGSQICSAHSLLSSAPHFGMSLRDAATWLGNAAVHVAQQWEPQLRDLALRLHTQPSSSPPLSWPLSWPKNPRPWMKH